MLALQALEVGYRKTRGAVLAPVSLTVEPGSFICVLGRNGAGKSTLMRSIAGLQPALGGSASLSGDDLARLPAAERARRIAVVLTERSTSPGLTVQDVVLLGRQPFTDWQGRFSMEDRTFAARALELVSATAFERRYFDDLSDGERQRVMIARALTQSPRLMVLDEITAFLDLPGRVEVMTLLRKHARETGTIVLLSSHDLDLSLRMADGVWLLDGKGGLSVGAPAELIADGSLGRAFDTEAVRFSEVLDGFEFRTT